MVKYARLQEEVVGLVKEEKAQRQSSSSSLLLLLLLLLRAVTAAAAATTAAAADVDTLQAEHCTWLLSCPYTLWGFFCMQAEEVEGTEVEDALKHPSRLTACDQQQRLLQHQPLLLQKQHSWCSISSCCSSKSSSYVNSKSIRFYLLLLSLPMLSVLAPFSSVCAAAAAATARAVDAAHTIDAAEGSLAAPVGLQRDCLAAATAKAAAAAAIIRAAATAAAAAVVRAAATAAAGAAVAAVPFDEAFSS
ncbi:hypothetical protein Emed_005637 [Eimeria media]